MFHPSVSERPYYLHNNNGFVKLDEQRLAPYFGFSFEVDRFVKFKNGPFIGRFEVKFFKLD